MERFESTLDIAAPASLCYERWHQCEQFPSFMKNVETVVRQGENRWHWVINGPFGQRIEWNAEVDSDDRNHSLSWHTTPSSDLDMQGTVRFDAVSPEQTRLRCFIQYDIPGNSLKEMLAQVMHSAQRMVDDELKNFKHWVEGSTMPAEKAHQGKVLASNIDTAERKEQAETRWREATSSETQHNAAPPYYGGLALEDETPQASTSTETDEVDVRDLIELQQEENPYLGTQGGAVYTEDDIDMRADETEILTIEEFDVFSDSMDVEEADLESFTEDLDDEIDGALPGVTSYAYREESHLYQVIQPEESNAGQEPESNPGQQETQNPK